MGVARPILSRGILGSPRAGSQLTEQDLKKGVWDGKLAHLFRRLLALALMLTGLTAIPAAAVEVGEPAPDFKLAEHHGSRYLPQRLSGQEVGAPRVLRRRLRADLSGEPVGQEGRLQALRRPGDPEPRRQRQPDVLAADVRRIAEAAVPAAQRLSRAEGHAQLRGPQREDDDCEPSRSFSSIRRASSARSGSSRTRRRRSSTATPSCGISGRSSESADDDAGRPAAMGAWPARRLGADCSRVACSWSPCAGAASADQPALTALLKPLDLVTTAPARRLPPSAAARSTPGRSR